MRKLDISELYDILRELGGTYVLCADIVGLKPINERYGFAAGDLALAQTAERIRRHLSGDMFLFRIGRDEFAAVTGYSDEPRVKALADAILSENGDGIDAGGHRFPLCVRIGMTQIPDSVSSCHEAFMNMQIAIDMVKNGEAASR